MKHTIEQKRNLVTEILKNDTFTTQSGLYLQAHAALMKLSYTALGQISLIVRSKKGHEHND